MADTTVTAKFRADTSDVKTKLDALQKQFEETQNKLSSAGAKMSSAGKKLTLGVTTPLVGIGVAAAKTAMDFETSMSKIVGLVGLSTDEVDGMRDSVLELSGATAKAPAELSDALFVVTSAGLRGEEALDALESAAKASTAGLGETADIARSVAGAMNAYGPATLDAARATDVIVATARAGNFETSQFAGAIGRVLPFA
ncbi:MAG TPA: phage tail tape measure protein, partial [Acidimicrobiia bacterium]